MKGGVPCMGDPCRDMAMGGEGGICNGGGGEGSRWEEKADR
jgi:hypothetical protein